VKKTAQIVILLVLLAVFLFVGRNKLVAFYYNRGSDLYQRHSYKEAIGFLNKAVWLDPGNAGIHYTLGNAYLDGKLEEDAVKEYTKAIQSDSSFAWGYKALAQIYLRRGSYAESLEVLKKAAAVIADNQQILELADHVAYEYKASLVNSAVDAFLANDKDKAHALMDKALQVDPDFAFARYLSGYFYYSEHKYGQAESMLKESLREENRLFPAHSLLGDIYFEQKDFINAAKEYKAALSVNGKDAYVLNNLGLTCMNMENYQEALLFLKEASRLEPKNVNIRYSLASVYRDNGKLDQAILEYKAVLNLRSDYPNAHNDLGDIYRQLGREPEAIEAYKNELSVGQSRLLAAPEDFVLLNSIAHAHNGLGEYDLAEEFIDKALAVKPAYQEAYLTLAGIYKDSGKNRQALEALEKAKGLSAQKYSFIERKIKDVKQLLSLMQDKAVLQ